MMDSSRYAENNSHYISNVLINNFKKKYKYGEYTYGKHPTDETKVFSNTNSGLYIFYMDHCPMTFPVYLYVGITSRSFHQRFQEHERVAGGIIASFRDNDNFPTINPNKFLKGNLKAIMFATDYGMTAKLLESMLLHCFDFCMNKAENGAKRMYVDPDMNQVQRTMSFQKQVQQLNNDIQKAHSDIHGLFPP